MRPSAGGEQVMQPARARTIDRDRLGRWIEALAADVDIIAPVAGCDGDAHYSRVESADEILWDFGNTLHPPKAFLLPQTDPLVRIRREPEGYRLEPVEHHRRQVLFNVRSCDVRGIAYLAAVHAADLPDEAFLRRVDRTVLISLACKEPCPDCFCVCTDSGPFLREGEGYDIQLTDLGARLLAEPGSERGRAMLEEASSLFEPAQDADLARRLSLEERARTSFGERTCHFASAMRRISTGRVADTLWEAMGDWCLECGGCTLVCPTCYCFSIKDQPDDGGWVRCRIWDSCQYRTFTLEASGHNPRAERKDRLKRRFFHKVSAQYFKRDGFLGCVGCGRCIKVCLGTTHMPAVVTAIRKGVWHG